MPSAVLDASAILALFRGEPGAKTVRKYLRGAMVSAVNVAEVGSRLADHGVSESARRRYFGTAGLYVVPFDEALAHASAQLRDRTREYGLSLGDRACLALALREGVPALTADRPWARIAADVEIVLIR